MLMALPGIFKPRGLVSGVTTAICSCAAFRCRPDCTASTAFKHQGRKRDYQLPRGRSSIETMQTQRLLCAA